MGPMKRICSMRAQDGGREVGRRRRRWRRKLEFYFAVLMRIIEIRKIVQSGEKGEN